MIHFVNHLGLRLPKWTLKPEDHLGLRLPKWTLKPEETSKDERKLLAVAGTGW